MAVVEGLAEPVENSSELLELLIIRLEQVLCSLWLFLIEGKSLKSAEEFLQGWVLKVA